MSNAVTRAFFIGRALAAVASEKVEAAATDALSELGKFDAEQREKLRQFTEEVLARAEQELSQATGGVSSATSSDSPGDLQATIDDLRAEIAQLRAALHARQSRSA